MNKLSWPKGWTLQTFHLALLAVRQHRVPDFSADVGLSPKSVRQVVDEVEELSEKYGQYLFDHHVKPESWKPAPHIPRAVLENVEKYYVKDYSNPTRIIQLMEMGQGDELLLTRACGDCNDIIVVTVKMAYAAVMKYKLQDGRYTPPGRCRICKEKRRKGNRRASVGAQIHAKRAAEPTDPEKEVTAQ
jgi:hypothetical protein